MNKNYNTNIAIVFILSMFLGNAQNETPIYLNPNIHVEDRVEDLMGRMTLEEKVYQMNVNNIHLFQRV